MEKNSRLTLKILVRVKKHLYQNIRGTEIIGTKTYSELKAFAASSQIEKFNEMIA